MSDCDENDGEGEGGLLSGLAYPGVLNDDDVLGGEGEGDDDLASGRAYPGILNDDVEGVLAAARLFAI